MNERILIVDDDKAFRIATTALLEDRGYCIRAVADAASARQALGQEDYDLLLTDLVMEGTNGIDLLQWIRERIAGLPVIMITGFGSISTAVQAMQLGAFDYITKPCDNDELVIKIDRALESHRQRIELARLREEVSGTYTFSNIVSQNQRMREIFTQVKLVAATDITVLILGETGTGKELIAKAIHYNSPRKEKPFIVVNCSALPETLLESELFGHEKNAFTGAGHQRIGRFEEADGGTMFLDEIGDVPLHIQTKLLRVLQERELQRIGGNQTIITDVRVVAATNRDLTAMRASGQFRDDLFYRLNEFPIHLPPLRARSEDIPLLAKHFLDKHAHLAGGRVASISPHVLAAMMQHEWQGNIRELENLIKRALVTCPGEVVESIDIPRTDPPGAVPVNDRMSYKEYMKVILQNAETAFLKRMLRQHHGNVSAVADLMDVDRKTVYRKIEEYEIDLTDFR